MSRWNFVLVISCGFWWIWCNLGMEKKHAFFFCGFVSLGDCYGLLDSFSTMVKKQHHKWPKVRNCLLTFPPSFFKQNWSSTWISVFFGGEWFVCWSFSSMAFSKKNREFSGFGMRNSELTLGHEGLARDSLELKLLLMEEIRLTSWGWLFVPLCTMFYNYIPGGAGFFPSAVW